MIACPKRQPSGAWKLSLRPGMQRTLTREQTEREKAKRIWFIDHFRGEGKQKKNKHNVACYRYMPNQSTSSTRGVNYRKSEEIMSFETFEPMYEEDLIPTALTDKAGNGDDLPLRFVTACSTALVQSIKSRDWQLLNLSICVSAMCNQCEVMLSSMTYCPCCREFLPLELGVLPKHQRLLPHSYNWGTLWGSSSGVWQSP